MRDGKKYGIYKEWNDDGGLLKEGYYKSGLMSKKWNFYYENGKINGIELTLNGNDTVSSKKYVFGVKSGQWKSFYNNGKPKEYATYKFNQLEGPFIHFFENGNKQYEGNYYRGKRTNDWIYYNSKGRPIFKETYRKGLIISKQEINKP